MAAPTYSGFLWMLVLGVCVSPVVGSDCREECALCVFRLLRQQSGVSSLTCSLECEGGLDSQKLRLCQDVLLEEETLNADPQQEQEVMNAMASEKDASPEQQVAKKYGGFMKRYGGFMSRRSSSPERPLADPGNQNEEETVGLEILKILDAVTNRGSAMDGQGGEVAKTYGGFMRRAGEGVVRGDLLDAVLDRGLKKRYGGFMRRVGRPEWLVDSSKSGGVLKRAWENGSELQKRYGGFMD
ncbi:proenkephalin-A-like [Brachionichthys hirsutus]|uniref:proenkephalin-A-like n=1 Tax=Brachionichthys hirsutus TaxID=412623 RepID=UPI0036051A9F